MNEWIDWPGGECPVAKDVRVSVRLRSGSEYLKPEVAIGYDWSHDNTGGDIIAYRVAAPLETGAPKGCITNEDVGYATAPSSVKFRNPPASPAATPITLCNGKPCAIAGQLDKQLADKERECADLTKRLRVMEGHAIRLQDARDNLRKQLAAQEVQMNAVRHRAEAAEAKLSTARQDALEEAAKVLDERSKILDKRNYHGYVALNQAAVIVRALKTAAIDAAIKGEGK